MAPEQQRLTRQQWRELEARESCRAHGHQPSHHVASWADPLGKHYCDCGDVTWTPTTKETR